MNEEEDLSFFIYSRVNVIQLGFNENLSYLTHLIHLYAPKPMYLPISENDQQEQYINETYSKEASIYEYFLLHFTNLYQNVLYYIEQIMEGLFTMIMNILTSMMDIYRSYKGHFDFLYECFSKFFCK